MRPSIVLSALMAVIVGFGSSFALILAAADALDATQAQTVSLLAGLGLGITINATILSWAFRMPITTAWSTPAASLLAASVGLGIEQAVAGFLVCGVLLALTALVSPLRRLVAALPMPLANALLAGGLFKFIGNAFPEIQAQPLLTLPMIGLFFILRLLSPLWAGLAALLLGLVLSSMLELSGNVPGWVVTRFILIQPDFDWQTALALGLPLYLVTMAGQNLPGIAALRAAGYTPDIRPILGLTGVTSIGFAFIGSPAQNLAAITATLCTGPDAHPDKAKRWMTGPILGLLYLGVALSSGWLVAYFTTLPTALILTTAAVGLSGPLLTALKGTFSQGPLAFPSLITFLVTQSGLHFWGLGSEFWALAVGLTLWGLQKMKSHLS